MLPDRTRPRGARREPGFSRANDKCRRRSPSAAALGLLWLWPATALATPDYPVALDLIVGTSCPLPNSRCLICHTTSRGGQGTAVQLFARELRQYGLDRGRDAAALQAALMALPDDWDSDGDGIADKDELAVCGNPSGEELGTGPQYGCDGARLAPDLGAERPLIALISALIVACCVLVRRRR